MQCRHIRFTWWFKWLCRPTYELGWNTKGGAGEHSTKERKKDITVIQKDYFLPVLVVCLDFILQYKMAKNRDMLPIFAIL